MSEFGENWCEELSKSLEVNSTVLDHWLVDVKCQEESYNLQSQSLSQQNFSDYPQIQYNTNSTNVESALIPLSNNVPNLFDYPQIQHNPNVTNVESALIPPSNNPPNLYDHPQIQQNANVTNVESALIPLSNNPPNMQSQNNGPPVQHRQRKPRKTWTVEEHVLFLIGLERYGMSWKRISKDIVQTKTPSQLASHAQKYFERQKIPPSERKRKSIHDITLPPPPPPPPPPVPFNVEPPLGQVNVTPPTQDFFMQNTQVPNIHPLVYAPAQNSYMQNIPSANVDPLTYTPLQDIYNQDIQGQQHLPPFNPPYYR